MISVIQATGVSDHRVQVVDFEIAFQHNSVPSHCVRSFKKCCWDDVRSYLSTAPWSVLNIFNDINDMWEFFYSVLQNCLDTHIPLKKVRSKYFKRPTPWITSDILAVIKAKYKAKRVAERTHNPVDLDNYRSIKNQLKMMVCTAKMDYVRSLLMRSRHAPKFAAVL